MHRAQNDPLIHDENAPSHVFAEVSGPSTAAKPNHKIKQRRDLEDEFGTQDRGKNLVRDNEGEAAEHGIYYDDTSYDYMQHLRELGGGPIASGGNVTWVEARKEKAKGKAKQSLEDALRDASLEDDIYDDAQSLGGLSFATSRTNYSQNDRRSPNYQNQQDVPDAIAGFQPNMDPRLREVLEALEDEAYVDDEEDIFAELAGEGAQELNQDEWEDTLFEDDEGWESDDTTKPTKEYDVGAADTLPLETPQIKSDDHTSSTQQLLPDDVHDLADLSTAASTNTIDGDWMASFTKSKGMASSLPNSKLTPAAPQSVTPSSAITTTTNGGTRRKKRKGALTSSTSFSMTSSVLARTETLTLLDSRFDRLAESYMNDDIPEEDDDDFDDTASIMTSTTNKTGMSRMSNMSRMSSASRWSKAGSEGPKAMPAGFDSIMDEFMGGAAKKVKGKKMKKGGSDGVWGQETGMQQLDDIRKGLGAARLRA